jgi:hypothetical protein
MLWKGATVSEQRDSFLCVHQPNYYAVADLRRALQHLARDSLQMDRTLPRAWQGGSGRSIATAPWLSFADARSDPRSSDQAAASTSRLGLREAIGSAAAPTPAMGSAGPIHAAQILKNRGLVRERRRHRREHPGCPASVAREPNEIWGADYKGPFRLGNGAYRFPQTVSDLHTRFLLGCDGHQSVGGEKTTACSCQAIGGVWLASENPNRQRSPVRIQRTGPSLESVGVVDRARYLPRAHRARSS